MGKIKIGKISGAQGLKGEVKLYHDSGDEEALSRFSVLFLHSDVSASDTAFVELVVEGLRYARKTPILKLAGVCSRDEAEALIGLKVYVDEDEARPKEAGAWLVSDLIGLDVCIDCEIIGKIKSIIDNPAHDIIEIERNGGTETDARLPTLLLPFIDVFVREVNQEAGYIKIIPPEGWLE